MQLTKEVIDKLEKMDTPINVHDGCNLIPFTTITFDDISLSIRYTIQGLLELEQLFRRSILTIVDQAFVGALGFVEKLAVLERGISPDAMLFFNNLNSKEQNEVLNILPYEIARALGVDVTYDESGKPISMQPRKKETYKQADVSDAGPIKNEFATFGQWYEFKLRQMFKIGTVMPIDQFLNMMPVELDAYFDAHASQNIYDIQLAMMTAWNTGNYTAAALNGKLPPLEPIIKKIEWSATKQSGSKFAKEQAQKVIDQNLKDRAAMDARLQQEQQKQQAKQANTVKKWRVN